MPGRRRRARCIGLDPGFICFKPCGKPGRGLQSVELRVDELEALRLSDLEGLYQEECARRMQISRTTLSRTLALARRKVADALLSRKRLVIAVPSADDRVQGPQTSVSAADQAGVKPPADDDAD